MSPTFWIWPLHGPELNISSVTLPMTEYSPSSQYANSITCHGGQFHSAYSVVFILQFCLPSTLSVHTSNTSQWSALLLFRFDFNARNVHWEFLTGDRDRTVLWVIAGISPVFLNRRGTNRLQLGSGTTLYEDLPLCSRMETSPFHSPSFSSIPDSPTSRIEYSRISPGSCSISTLPSTALFRPRAGYSSCWPGFPLFPITSLHLNALLNIYFLLLALLSLNLGDEAKCSCWTSTSLCRLGWR
jgi:hypothetical protein